MQKSFSLRLFRSLSISVENLQSGNSIFQIRKQPPQNDRCRADSSIVKYVYWGNENYLRFNGVLTDVHSPDLVLQIYLLGVL